MSRYRKFILGVFAAVYIIVELLSDPAFIFVDPPLWTGSIITNHIQAAIWGTLVVLPVFLITYPILWVWRYLRSQGKPDNTVEKQTRSIAEVENHLQQLIKDIKNTGSDPALAYIRLEDIGHLSLDELYSFAADRIVLLEETVVDIEMWSAALVPDLVPSSGPMQIMDEYKRWHGILYRAERGIPASYPHVKLNADPLPNS